MHMTWVSLRANARFLVYGLAGYGDIDCTVSNNHLINWFRFDGRQRQCSSRHDIELASVQRAHHAAVLNLALREIGKLVRADSANGTNYAFQADEQQGCFSNRDSVKVTFDDVVVFCNQRKTSVDAHATLSTVSTVCAPAPNSATARLTIAR